LLVGLSDLFDLLSDFLLSECLLSFLLECCEVVLLLLFLSSFLLSCLEPLFCFDASVFVFLAFLTAELDGVLAF